MESILCLCLEDLEKKIVNWFVYKYYYQRPRILHYLCRYFYLYLFMQISKNLLMLIEYKNIANSCKEPTSQQPSKRDESGLRKVSAKFVQMQKVGCSNCLEGSCQEADQKSDFCAMLASNSQNPHPEIKLQIEVSGSVAAGSSLCSFSYLQRSFGEAQ